MPSEIIKREVTTSTSGRTNRLEFVASDDGNGHILGDGTVAYSTGDIALPVLPVVSQSVWDVQGEWGAVSGGSSDMSFQSGIVTCRYTPADADDEPLSVELPAPAVTIRLVPMSLDASIVPGSILLSTGSGANYRTLRDQEGVLYQFEIGGQSGTPCGTVDYLSGVVAITTLPPAFDGAVTVLALLVKYGDYTSIGAEFRADVVPLVPQSVYITAVAADGTAISGSSDEDGIISGEWCAGLVNYQFGTGSLAFGKVINGEWERLEVDPATIRYSAVAYKYLPLDASIIGIDAVRLPPDGRLPVFRPGDFAVVGHTDEVSGTYSDNQVVDLGRVRLSRVRVTDHDGTRLAAGDDYDVDLDAGKVTMGDLSGFAQPLTIEHRVEDMVLVSDAQFSGAIGFTRPLTHNYPLGSYISSCIMGGDLKSRVSVFFDQLSWDQTSWSDAVSGNEAAATYNNILFPPIVTNLGAVTERWALRFTSSTTFEVIGEHFGKIATGQISEDCAPINPATNMPFFTVRAGGWGTGWVIGNIVRLNTVGAMVGAWLVRSIKQGPEAGIDYTFELLARGSVDRP